MAIFWGLYAEFGRDPSPADGFVDHFDNTLIELADGTRHFASAGREEHDGATWAVVTAADIPPSGSPHDADESCAMTELALRLYERLKTAPDFRYAIVTNEADSWLSEKDLLEEDRGIPAGMVLADAFWIGPARPEELEPFRDGYAWIPYAGESHEPHVYDPLRDRPHLARLLASLRTA